MTQVNFFTPIRFSDKNTFNSFLEAADAVFAFGSKRVVYFKDGTAYFEEIKKKPQKGFLFTLSKILTVVVKILLSPLALIVKGVHRSFRKIKIKGKIDAAVGLKNRCPVFETILNKVPEKEKEKAIVELNKLFGGSHVDSKYAAFISGLLESSPNPSSILLLLANSCVFNIKQKGDLLNFFETLPEETKEIIKDLQKKLPPSFKSSPELFLALIAMDENERNVLCKDAQFLGFRLLLKIAKNGAWLNNYHEIKREFKKIKKETFALLLEKPELKALYKEIEAGTCHKWVLHIAEKGSAAEAISVLKCAKVITGQNPKGITEDLLKKIHRMPKRKRGSIEDLFKNKAQLFLKEFPFIVRMTTTGMDHFEKIAISVTEEQWSVLAKELQYIPEEHWDKFKNVIKPGTTLDEIKRFRLIFEACLFDIDFFNKFRVSRFQTDDSYISYFSILAKSKRKEVFEKTWKIANQDDLLNTLHIELGKNIDESMEDFKALVRQKLTDEEECKRLKGYWNFPTAGFLSNDSSYAILEDLKRKVVEEEFFYPSIPTAKEVSYKDTLSQLKKVKVAFDLDGIRDQDQVKVLGKHLPKDVTETRFDEFIKKNQLENVDSYVKHKDRFLSYLKQTFEDGNEIPYFQYCLRYALKNILDETKTPRQKFERFFKFLPEKCIVGFEDSFQIFYSEVLPSDQRLGKLQMTQSHPIYQVAESTLLQQFKFQLNSLDFLSYNYSQGSHEARYIDARLSHQLGLPHTMLIDPYTFCIKESKELETQELIDKLFKYYTVNKFLEALLLNLNSEDHLKFLSDSKNQNQLIELLDKELSTTDASGYFDWPKDHDGEDDYTKGIQKVRMELAIDIAKALHFIKDDYS